GAQIHASVPTGPAKDGLRGCRGRRLDGHICRKSGCSDQCDGGDGGCQPIHVSPRKPAESIPCSRPGGCCCFSTVKGKNARQHLIALARTAFRQKDCPVVRPFLLGGMGDLESRRPSNWGG